MNPIHIWDSELPTVSEDDLALLRKSSAFDPVWYVENYEGVTTSRIDPALHFLSIGWELGYYPSAGFILNFDLQDYLAVRPDVEELGVHPVAHYLAFGISERPASVIASTMDDVLSKPIGAATSPARSGKALRSEVELTRHSPLFDPKWYVGRYPESVSDGFDPRRHFLLHAALGYDPSPYFSSGWYLENSPELRLTGENPLVHYLRRGHCEGRAPHPAFDIDWYRRRYLAKTPKVEPVAYHLMIGRSLGHRAHPLFDPAYYLDRYQDVRDSKLDPYLHWISNGRAEGRHGQNPAILGKSLKVGVIAHLTDERMWPQLAARLQAVPVPFELIVTVAPNSLFAASVQAAWPAAAVIEVPEDGRDIGAFLRVLPLLLERGCDVVCKIHSERGSIEPDTFRHMLLEGVLGSAGQVRKILAWFEQDPDLGMLGPAQLYLDGPRTFGPDEAALEALFRRVKGLDLPMPDHWGFFAGSMFWIRPEMLGDLMDVDLPSLSDGDNRSADRQTADVVERLVGLIAATRGRRIGLTDVSAARATTDVDVRRAPNRTVLKDLAEALAEKTRELARRNPAPGLSRAQPWSAPEGAALGVTFVGPIEAVHGLGASARGYVAAAIATGMPVHVIKWQVGFDRVRMRNVAVPALGEQAINIVHLNLDLMHSTRLLDQPPLDQLLSPDCFNIAIVLWELLTVNPDWVETIHRFDEIWVSSSFMARAMQSVAAIPVRIVRPAVEFAPRQNEVLLPFALPKDRCIFFYASDLGSVARRKNPEAFWRAYATEFDPSDGAFCLVKLHYADPEHPLLVEIAALAASRPDVLLVTDSLSDIEMEALFARIDCYVSPHRAEGLGLTLLEAMLAGKPVIATGFSGEGDFVRDDTALLIDYELIEVGEGAEPYMAGASWADPNQDSLRARMRQVLADRGAAKSIGARGRECALALFSLEQTSARLKDEITRIWRAGGGATD